MALRRRLAEIGQRFRQAGRRARESIAPRLAGRRVRETEFQHEANAPPYRNVCQGLQKSASDFGRLGGEPVNPLLLDWLAAEFVKQNFSMKQMHRLIVTSAKACRNRPAISAGWAESP